RDGDGAGRAGTFWAGWEAGLPKALTALWTSLHRLDNWNPLQGWNTASILGNPYPSAYLLALLLLGRQPETVWISPAAVDRWVTAHHPYWGGAVASGAGSGVRKEKATSAELNTGPSPPATVLPVLAYPL